MDLFERMRGRMERDALQEGVGPGGISAESGMILLDQLLMQLQMESNSHSGPPPASKAFIESIPSVDIKPGMDKECPICVEPFENLVAKQLPCKHRFHGGCVVPWLNSHNTCPICRREFPTDVQKVPPGSSMAEVHEAARAAVEENDPDWMYG
ncbi:hypothetical protein BJ742DRAFT_840472 [Cladochytrium replicatum]|nr:hypothetical protein BJ742DRAFT_840472 [Cladochytrium replicatum]